MPKLDAEEPSRAKLLRSLPKVDNLLAAPALLALGGVQPRRLVVEETRRVLAQLRLAVLGGQAAAEELALDAVAGRIAAALSAKSQPYYRRVINATGVILHTGIGRAPLAPEAVDALTELAGHAQRLEIDLATGQRGGRDEGCAALLREITGCEAATVVNNNAAATILVLSALGRGKKVIVSRGELVEIGGSFRIPDVMTESGAILKEVGTTNRTHLADYRDAVDAETGILLKVHPSNYRIEGFTSEVSIEELVALGGERGLAVVHDLGSGCLVDLAGRGLPGETMVQQSIAAGADIVCFSGDKLLGGPQAGIVAGRREAVDRCRRHPLMRALRPGRLIYSALEATLRLYLGGEDDAFSRVPVLRRLTRDPAELRRSAGQLARRLRAIPGLAVKVVRCMSQAGSGSMPARDLPSWAVAVLPAGGGSAVDLALRLRTGSPAILTRMRDDAILFDVRTLDNADFTAIAGQLHRP